MQAINYQLCCLNVILYRFRGFTCNELSHKQRTSKAYLLLNISRQNKIQLKRNLPIFWFSRNNKIIAEIAEAKPRLPWYMRTRKHIYSRYFSRLCTGELQNGVQLRFSRHSLWLGLFTALRHCVNTPSIIPSTERRWEHR